MDFKIGEIVNVVDDGHLYDTFHLEDIEDNKDYIRRFQWGSDELTGEVEIIKIYNTMYTASSQPTMLLVQSKYLKLFLIGIDGVEKKNVIKYIKCDVCGNPIYFGDECYTMSGRCGKYCTTGCFAYAYGEVCVIDEDEASNSCAEIFEEIKEN